MVLSFLVQIGFFAQEPRRLARDVARFTRVASDTRQSGPRLHLEMIRGGLHVLQGDLDGCEACFDVAESLLPDDVVTIQRFAVARQRFIARPWSPDPARELEAYLAVHGSDRRYRLTKNIWAGLHWSIFAMLEANALRVGDRRARPRRLRSSARAASSSPPLMASMATRALAYAEDALGRPERALELLARAAAEADAHGRPVDAAIARYQRGRRLGGDEGREAMERARAEVTRVGASPRLLDEDAGGR
ncbi:MAG: hypothetical protein R3B82_24520 [Sandaracinaceae bacterium]